MWWETLKCRNGVHNETSLKITILPNHAVIPRARERVLHNGVRETLTELESMFWIISGKVGCEVNHTTMHCVFEI